MSLEEYFLSPAIFINHGFILLSICGLLFWHLLRRAKLNLPPGPICLPLVGYLPFLGKEPFRTLHNLSKKYGNVFSLYMGRKYVVILGDYTAVKEAYSKTATLDRPEGIFDFQPDGLGIASFNGAKWVEQRRAFVKTMKDLGLGRSKWEQLVEDEVSDFLQVLANTKATPTDIGKHLVASTANNTSSLVFGRRLPPGPQMDMLCSGLHAIMEFFAQAGIWNYFPWLCNIMVKLEIGNYRKYFSAMSDFNAFVRKEIEIRKKAPADSSKSTDFVSSYIETVENKGKEGDTDFNESSLIGNTQVLFLTASDTTHTSLMWLLLAMTAYPNVQKNIHHELDSVLGREQTASWKDRSKLPYTYAAIMEAQRWRTTVPLGVARIASQDFRVCGYDVPKGSLVISNFWALHNDSSYWKDPEYFIPERFLGKEDKDINIKMESYVPFSYGKRRCPGEIVALMEIFLYFTSIMHRYKVQVPNGGKPNFDAVLGATFMPVSQDLCFVPRSEERVPSSKEGIL